MESPLVPSNLFLREEELRRGLELLFFAYRDSLGDTEKLLRKQGFGRAHHRALYFIARNPSISVTGLLTILQITKQSLARVLSQLIEKGYVLQTPGLRDRRQRLLTLTPAGSTYERSLFDAQKERIKKAYSDVGADAVAGFWKVLWHVIDEENREVVLAAHGPSADSPHHG